MKIAHLIFLTFTGFTLLGQSRANWTRLDYLNEHGAESFQPERQIDGVSFLILSESYDYYSESIYIPSRLNELIRIEVKEDKVTVSYNGKPIVNEKLFDPWLYSGNPDYFRLAFLCTDSVGSFYNVLLNDNESIQIPKTDNTFTKREFVDFVRGYTSMGFDFDRKITPLKQEPTDNSKTINHTKETKFRIWTGEAIEVKGDWIKVRTVEDEVGWIRWRNGKVINIRMYYVC